MNEYRIGYVILHYNSIDETYKAIDSVNKLLNRNDVIIVVDNASPNGSGSELVNHYRDIPNIYIIINEKNLGFANGNNVGITMALDEFLCDFIVVMNNDITIMQADFRNQIVKAYCEYDFAVLGPKIFDSFGNVYINNPRKPPFTKPIHAIRGMILNDVRLILSYINCDEFVNTVGRKLQYKHALSKNNEVPKNINLISNRVVENMRIHGCCFVLSKNYTNIFSGLNPGTFLYLEEDILYIRCYNNGLKILYYPGAEVVHKGSVAVKQTISKKNVKIRRFIYKHQVKSFLVLYEEMKAKSNKNSKG